MGFITMGTPNQRATDPNFYCDCENNKKICKRPYPPEYYSIERNKYLVDNNGKTQSSNRQTARGSKKDMDAQNTGQY